VYFTQQKATFVTTIPVGALDDQQLPRQDPFVLSIFGIGFRFCHFALNLILAMSATFLNCQYSPPANVTCKFTRKPLFCERDINLLNKKEITQYDWQ